MKQIKTTTLWLIRHAEVEPRYQSIFGGRIDMELSERGHQQAAALALYLRDRHLDALYASPMRRVQQTLAHLVSLGTFPQPVVISELREVDFGEWTGLSWDQVQKQFGVSPFSWLEQLEQGSIKNAENASTLRTRLEPCLRQIVERHHGQQAAILCHGGVIRMVLAIFLEWKFSSMGAFEIDYASLSQLSVASSRVRVQLLNFTPWLDVHGRTPAISSPPHTGVSAPLQ